MLPAMPHQLAQLCAHVWRTSDMALGLTWKDEQVYGAPHLAFKREQKQPNKQKCQLCKLAVQVISPVGLIRLLNADRPNWPNRLHRLKLADWL